MPKFSFKSLVAGALAVGASLVLATSAQATPNLPNVSNLNFVNYTGSAPKGSFTSVNPVGWTGGTGLIFIDGPGAPGCAACADGPQYLSVYGPFSPPPIPGNYVEADGNPTFESGFNQVITGLTPGKTYTLSFYQAGGQQRGFAGPLATTEQWIVSLGTAGLTICPNCGPVDPTYGQTSTYMNSDATASIAASQLMTTPSGGVTPWQYVSVQLTADSTTDLLSFLAWGDNGSTVNLPPMAFLSAVNARNVLTPEPATIALFGFALAGAGGMIRRRRSKKNNVA